MDKQSELKKIICELVIECESLELLYLILALL